MTNNSALPELAEGWDWLEMAVPVNLEHPAASTEMSSALADAYRQAVARRTAVTA